MSNSEGQRFPTQAEAMDLIEPGRRPYTMVRETLALDGREQNRLVPLSIRALHKAQTDGTLDPPLNEQLAEAIERADSFINEHGTPEQMRGFDYSVGVIILSAVFEHGYQRAD